MNRSDTDSLMLVGTTHSFMEAEGRTKLHNMPTPTIPSETSLDCPTSLTRIGIMLFQINDFPNAQEHFLSALRLSEGSKFGNSAHSLKKISSSASPSRCATSMKRPCLSSSSAAASPTPVASVSCSKDCDEGIHEFSEAVMFSEEANLEEITMTLQFNIAMTFLSMKNFDDAISWFRKALAQTQAAYGGHSVAEYKMMHNLGYCSYHLEDYEGAITYFHGACQMLPSLDLSDHIMATQTYHCIGVLFFNLADPDTESALKVFRRCLEIYNNRPASYTPSQLATLLNNFGRVFYLKGELEEAAKFYQQSLAIRRQELGNTSIDVAATVYNLGNTYHKMKQLSLAKECYDEFLAIAETHLGLQTREVAFVYKCKAEILQEMKEPESALQHYDKALTFSKTALGDDHREILNKAGNLCFEFGSFQEALKYYLWGLDVEKSHPDPDENLLVVTLTNIAQTHKQLGSYREALSTYREIHSIQVRNPSTSQLEIASTLSSIGLMLYHLKQYEAAFETYQNALQARRDFYGDELHADIASTLNAIGLVLFKQGLYDLCMQCFNECLEIRRTIFGPDHGDVAMVWYNLASVSFETGDDETALLRYEEALRVERVSLGDRHPDIILTMVHLGQAYQQCGLLDQALVTFEEALRIHHAQPEEDCMREARIYNFLGNILLQKGDIPNMMTAFAAASRILMSTRCLGEPLAIKGYNLYGLSKLHPECAPAA